VVIGGGLSGLHTALRLAERGFGVCMLESASTVGGRVRTAFEEGGRVSYEAGAWRVDVTHSRVRALFRRFEVPLVPAPTATVLGSGAPLPHGPAPAHLSVGLTDWGRDALAHGVEGADLLDVRAGYAGASDSAHGSNPHGAVGPFLVAPDGFSRLVQRLYEAVVAAGVDVRLNARVVGLAPAAAGECRYLVRCRARDGGRFADSTIVASHVVLCVPPHVWGEWSILRTHARSLLSAVDAEALQHIYVRGVGGEGEGGGVGSSWVSPDLGQVVASQYPHSGWWQVSYASGRVARMWRDYAMQDEGGFLARIQRLARAVTGLPAPSKVSRHFWYFAFHKWKAVPNFDLERAVKESIRVNPVRLAGVLCAGEAFSSHQGWMEGALETSEMVVASLPQGAGRTTRETPPPAAQASECTVYVEGRRMDVCGFAKVHPGGAAALRNHGGEHLDEYMMHVGHSPYAWAIVHSLKRSD